MEKDTTYGCGAREGYRVVFNGILGQVLQNGSKEYYRRPPGVRAIVDTGEGLIIQREKRDYLKRKWDYRIPGGKSFDSLVDWVEDHAKVEMYYLHEAIFNELQQEVGIIAKITSSTQHYLSESSASVEHDLHYFVITEFEEGEAMPQHDEVIEKLKLSYKEVFNLLLDGDFSEDRTRAILFQYLLTQKKEHIF